ncbi:MAG: 4-hydroxy-tetrahydrodipicolinate reductase [Actinomycetota bacterium]|nr:4-hydroxy-tetrahydrodipicolinate reductase [Actinomycetota bacterium]
MGRLVAEAIEAAEDLELAALYDPAHAGQRVAGLEVEGQPDALQEAQVVVEFTRPEVVMGNLRRWRGMGLNAVVGTSGFTEARFQELRRSWGPGPPNCLVAPNFSIGAVLLMRLAELAAPFFSAAEVIELHHEAKADAPSGTALATARRLADARRREPPAVQSEELVPGARGAAVAGVPVHAVRLPGLVAHQEVILGAPGQVLTLRHDTTDRRSFLPGVLLAVRRVGELTGVTVGLEALLEI